MKSIELSYFKDNSNTRNISNIIQTQNFIPIKENHLSLGYDQAPLWLKIKILNNSDSSELFLEFSESIWKTFNLYRFTNNQWIVDKNGLEVPLENRSIKKITPSFKLQIEPNTSKTYYIYAQSNSGNIGEFKLLTHKEFHEQYKLEIEDIYILLLIALSVIFFINIYNYFLTNDNTYLYYIAYIFILIIFLSMHSGVYLIFGLHGWDEGLHTTGALTLLLFMVFSDKFLNLKKHVPVIHRFFLFSIYVFSSLALLLLFDVPYASLILNLYATIFFICLFYAAMKVFYKGSMVAKYYLLGLMIYLPLMSLMSLTFNGFLDYSVFGRHIFILGSLIEVFLFTLILSSKYKYINDEKIRLKTKLIKQQEKNRKNLKKEIQFQTKEISEILNKFAFAADNALSGYWEIDLETNNIQFSNGWFEYLGYSQEEFKGIDVETTMQKIIYPDDMKLVHNAVNDFLFHKTDKYDVEFRVIHKDKSITWINAVGTIYEKKFFGFHIDIDKLKKINSLILEQEKMASLVQMIGNIAHQWRQPLSIISSASSGIQIKSEFGALSDEFLQEACNSINKNTQYLSKTIDDFKSYIKGKQTTKQFNLEKTIESFLVLIYETLTNNHINVKIDLHEEITLHGLENQLIQCFMNIFNNSQEAFQKKQNNTEHYFLISAFTNEQDVIIKLKDNAGGIDEEILHQVFEPYFTTKHQAQGTGIGLHMTYSLVTDAMKGTIEASNQIITYKGKDHMGTCITITLPQEISS
jgi:PAS domain S-box-containing protein